MLSAIINNAFKIKNKYKSNNSENDKIIQDNLEKLHPNEAGTVIGIGNKGPIKRRLMDMGITPGVKVRVVKIAPFGDPIEINVRGYELSLRRDEAEQIIINRI